MMKKYIRHIPNAVNYDLFPYAILFNNSRCEFIIGIMLYKYVYKYTKSITTKTCPMIVSENNRHILYNTKMSKSIANIIIKEIMKCT